MSYNEIMQALEKGFKVYWINSSYKVFLDNGKKYTRKIKYKPFSNFPIEYINWNNTTYQVNTVKDK